LAGVFTSDNPFNGLFSRTTRVSQHRKGKAILDFKEATRDRVAVVSAGPYANHLHLTPDRQPCQHLITQLFTGQMLFLTLNQQCESTEGKISNWNTCILLTPCHL